MSLYKNVLKELRENRSKRLKGDRIAIPWFRLPRLANVLPGIMPEHYVIVSANQKIGKTQLADFLYVYQPIDWLFENRDTNLDIEILYISLEMSKEAKMRQAISYRLFTKYGITISPQKLRSLFGGYIIEEKILKLIEQEEEWLDFFESKVKYIDSIRNPYGIYKTASEHLLTQGHIEYKDEIWEHDGKKNKIRDRIVYDNPDKIHLVLTDHVSLLNPERGETLYKAIGDFSSKYCLDLRDFYKCCVINIQQQMPTSESVTFYKGKSLIEMAKPSSDGLGDNKSPARDCNLILFLFNPSRYSSDRSYAGLDLSYFEDSHREFTIGINRDGIDNASINLYFNGASNYFEEIPEDLNEEFLLKIEKYNKNRV